MPKQFNGRITYFSRNDTEQLDIYRRAYTHTHTHTYTHTHTVNFNLNIISFIKITKNRSQVKCTRKTIKVLEKITQGENPWDLGLSKEFVELIAKA